MSCFLNLIDKDYWWKKKVKFLVQCLMEIWKILMIEQILSPKNFCTLCFTSRWKTTSGSFTSRYFMSWRKLIWETRTPCISSSKKTFNLFKVPSIKKPRACLLASLCTPSIRIKFLKNMIIITDPIFWKLW